MPRRGSLTLVEAKSGETPGRDLFGGVRRVRGLLDGGSKPLEPVVVYGGREAQERSEGRLIPWAKLRRTAWI